MTFKIILINKNQFLKNKNISKISTHINVKLLHATIIFIVLNEIYFLFFHFKYNRLKVFFFFFLGQLLKVNLKYCWLHSMHACKKGKKDNHVWGDVEKIQELLGLYERAS